MSTINFLYSEHHRVQALVSVIEKIGNSGSYFQLFVFPGISTPVRDNGVSVIARCPQGES